MRRLGAMLIAGWVGLLLGEPALAEKRVALVIGNSTYENVSRLGNPANDATAMAETLKEAGFDVVDSRRNLKTADMRRAFRDFSEKSRDADVAVVYYAGHGIEVDGTNYIIPVDAALERDLDVYDEAFPLDRILVTIEPAKQLRLVILDACRDNPFVKTMKRTIGSRAVGRGLAKIEPTSPNTLIAFAAKAGSTASDGDNKNSPFTSALIKHIATPGLDLRKAFGFVRDDVLKKTSNRQEPYVYGSLGGDDFPLVPAKPAVNSLANPQAEMRRDYELALQLNTREGWQAFLAQFPEGFYANLAKGQLNKIASEEARIAATEKARLAFEEKARLAAEGAKQAEQAKAAVQARAAEEARVAAEKAKQVEQAKVAAAEQVRATTENAAAEKTAVTKVKAETVAELRQMDEKAAGTGAVEAKPQEQLPQQVASLAAETAAVSPPATTSLIKNIKIELKRIGCYSGQIDESWPKRSSNPAVRTFARYAKLSSVPEAPSAQLLELLKSKPEGLCPLECGDREVEQNGRCIKRPTPPQAIGVTPPTGRPLSGIARADNAYSNGAYRQCMGPRTGCYARAIKHGEDHARQWCSRRPTC
ncbi:caspase family protein [Bradyrhizobium roseum]|uniref:caspase family protein n=1 Tax=Bradyrhizobium roseum TaxID=3056648 RepID=UPI00262FCD62|nr:caspase family protein [Bradyrhizobium roseus]WKA26761.1 caspase family protein [Bradyrhizobium roseus]